MTAEAPTFRPRDIRGVQPTANRDLPHDMLAGVILFILLITATSLDHLWYGALPLWLIAVMIGYVHAFLSPGTRTAMLRFLSVILWPIVVPWCAFMLAVLLVDGARGVIELTVSKRIFLNLATLGLLVIVGTMATRVRPSTFVYMLAFIGAAEGTVGIAQYLDVPNAWKAPEAVARFFGAKLDANILQTLEYGDVGRVRGTNPLVHKFNAMQGVIAVFLLTAYLLNVQARNALRIKRGSLLVAVTLAILGMLLTFSRSTVLGALLALLAVILSVRRPAAAAGALILFVATAYVGLMQLQILDAPQLGRLADFTESRETNAARLDQYTDALRAFADNPLAGRGSRVDSEEVPVHSVVLRVMADYGTLGLLPYLWVIGGIVALLYRGSTGPSEVSRIIALASLCAVATGVIDAWTHSSGLMLRDVAQPALVGGFLGALLGQVPGARVANTGARGSGLRSKYAQLLR